MRRSVRSFNIPPRAFPRKLLKVGSFTFPSPGLKYCSNALESAGFDNQMPLLNNKCLKVHPEFYSGHRVITCILNHPKSPPSEVTVTYRSILDRDAAGSPERARLLHLAPSVSQSLRAIWFILPSHGATIKDKSVETVEQNKRFLSASFRNFKNRLSVDSLTPPLPLFNVEIRFVDTVTWLQH